MTDQSDDDEMVRRRKLVDGLRYSQKVDPTDPDFMVLTIRTSSPRHVPELEVQGAVASATTTKFHLLFACYCLESKGERELAERLRGFCERLFDVGPPSPERALH